MSDTIAAIATGLVVSAIGIIRLSGDSAIEIAQTVFAPSSGKKLSDYPDRTLVFGSLHSTGGELLDRCLCTISHGPKSYTGENTAEFQCHGSPAVLRMALEALFSCGARQAAAGEFTKRAFLNGRMELTQAEAVIDLIEAESPQAVINSAGQLNGVLQQKIDSIYSDLVDIISHYQAVLDYPDEGVEEFQLSAYKNQLGEAKERLSRLVSSFESGRVMRSGIKTAIVGKPNAGKSSLMNSLLGYDRAIVTDIPGTTRDTIEETITLGGVLLCLIDTAGLRSTNDPIEKIGVDRAKLAAESCQLLLAVFDGSESFDPSALEYFSQAGDGVKRIAVINKLDLPQKLEMSALEAGFNRVCQVSALNGEGIGELEQAISELFPLPSVPAGEILTNVRHFDAVSAALSSIDSALSAMKEGETPDIVLTRVEEGLLSLGQLSGKVLTEDVTQRVFSRFCVGK